jgi:imidazolonepropionase-like amidohydrolase
MMVERGTYLIPTIMWTVGFREKLASGSLAPTIVTKGNLAMSGLTSVMRKAVAKGVKIGFGTDAGTYPHGRNAEEFRS